MRRTKNIPPLTLALAFIALSYYAFGQPAFSLSNGVYRIPYADSTEVSVTRDHITHDPAGRIDMHGINGTSPYKVVAAANGTIRYVDDSHENADCDTTTGCAPCNNYVWIEHPNGEWSKYTHFIKGSVSDLGWEAGDPICVGDYLGDEGDIGCASGVHLHFEIAVPDDLTNPFDTIGGYINGVNLIPVICGIDNRFFFDGGEYMALPCDETGCDDEIVLEDTILQPVFVFMAATSITALGETAPNTGSAGLFQAGQMIRLSPNFAITKGTEFNGRIGPCNKPVWAPVDGCTNFTEPNPQFLTISSTPEKLGLALVPNPVSDLLSVGFILPKACEYQLTVMDLQGKPVQSLFRAGQDYTGFHTFELDVSGLHPGAYFITIQTDDEIDTKKFMVVR